ncbi:hypothetical protein E1B28_012092 [Marasmius oreades]|uniref:Uncharacterized protein n=1 Tax=Marasmius oreades TaxID=181124 RepID=A0A9P7RRM2_9AGAR|nr:uncharacterized protein E1B28_012092 [Marasmius oreades]KAG7088060.1 hypothetical protein E1B28_012092 [Marasmius oreades]
METNQVSLANRIANTSEHLKRLFLDEYTKPPTIEDIKRWNREIAEHGEDYSACTRCVALSISCSTDAPDVIACTACVREEIGRYCSRNLKEREARAGRVLKLDHSLARALGVGRAIADLDEGSVLEVGTAPRSPTGGAENGGDCTPSGSPSRHADDLNFKDFSPKPDDAQSTQVPEPEPDSFILSKLPLQKKEMERESRSNGFSPRKSNRPPRKPPSVTCKEQQMKIESLERQLEEMKINLSDTELKLRDEISRTTELAQQVEVKRRENADFERTNTRLNEEVKESRIKLKLLEFKKKQLEMKVSKEQNELKQARRVHVEKLNESAFELEKCRNALAVKTAELEKEKTANKEVQRKLGEGYDAVRQAMRTYESDQQRWISENDALKEEKKSFEAERKVLAEKLAKKEQAIQEMQKDFKAQIQEWKQSADEWKRKMEDSRRSQKEMQDMVQAGRNELQKVKMELDSRMGDLTEERELAKQKQQAIDDAAKEFTERESAIDLVHINIERLIQQFHSVRSAFVNHKVTEEKVVETCDHLGWQLVSISDSIREGIKRNNESESTLTSVRTTSGSTFETSSSSSSGQAIQRPYVHAFPQGLSTRLPPPLPRSPSVLPGSAHPPSQDRPPLKPSSLSQSDELSPSPPPTPLEKPSSRQIKLRRVILDSDDSDGEVGARPIKRVRTV